MSELSTTIIAIANVILVWLIYIQIRHIYRPIISTKVLGEERGESREVEERPCVSEVGALYLVISNLSNNLASNLKIEYEFLWKDKKLIAVDNTLDHLNPNEAIKLLLKKLKIKEEHPELFEEKIEGNVRKIIPKETLKLLLNIRVSSGRFPKYEVRDSYEIEWGSLRSYPDFDSHPIVNCWNKRNDLYIHKLGEKEKAIRTSLRY